MSIAVRVAALAGALLLLAAVAFDVMTSSHGDVRLCSTYRGRDLCDRERRHWSNDHDDDDRGHVSVATTVLV